MTHRIPTIPQPKPVPLAEAIDEQGRKRVRIDGEDYVVDEGAILDGVF